MSVWQRGVAVGGKQLTAKEYVSHFYKTKIDKELAAELSAMLGVSVAGEDVRWLRRRNGWIKEPWRAGKGTESSIVPVAETNDNLGEAIVKRLGAKPVGIDELSRLLDRSEASILAAIEDLQDQGYGIVVKQEAVALSENGLDEEHSKARLSVDIDDEGWFAFAVISDTQLGSVWEQPTALNTFIEWAYAQGIRLMFHPGDISDGVNVYKGHWLNLYARTFEEQEWLIENRFPKKDGLRYVMLGGNHDMAWFKQHGRNIMQPVCQKRDDILYLGYVKGTVVLKIRGREYKIILWHPGGGSTYAKCLSEDTDILTRRGWIGCKQICLDDDVATLDVQTGMLEYQKPTELFVQEYAGKMVHFKSRTIDHLVTPEHDMWVRKYNEAKGTGQWKKIESKKLLHSRRQEWQMSMIAEWEGEEVSGVSIPHRPWSGSRDLGIVPADEFLTFLGWYISEGCTDKHGKYVGVTQTGAPAVEGIIKVMRAIGLHPNIRWTKRTGCKDIAHIRACSADLVRWLDRECGRYAAHKKVPDFVKGLSSRQIRLFLDSLFAGDGNRHPNDDGFEFNGYNSVSQQLRDDVQELLLKAGYAGTIDKSGNGRRVGVLRQGLPTINERPRLVDYRGKIWCVKVPNGLIYARRNGKALWTGNSYRLQRGGVIEIFREFAKKNLDGPKLLAILAGHLHFRISLGEGGVLMMQCGCFQSETWYLEEKGLLPEIGGDIVRMHVGEDGFVDAIKEEWRGFQPIEDDWKNWPTPQQATDRTKQVVYLEQQGEGWSVD